MVPSRKWTSLAIATMVFVFGAAAARAAQSAGTWSGTVAAVKGDDIALVGVPAHFRLAGRVTEMASGRSLAPQTLAPGTSVTLRVGSREEDGRFRADRVVVESKSPLSVTGAIGRIADDRRHIEVQGVEIELDRSTGFSGSGSSGRLRSARDLRPGAVVSASLVPTTAGTLRAAEIRAASGTAEAGEDQELKGTVTDITDTAWTIDTKVLVITDQTVFEGEPGLGDFVEVKFHDDGTGTMVADRISKEDDAPGMEIEFMGIVEAIGDASWTISGSVMGVDSATQILGNPQVGNTVEVHANKAADGSLTASEIKLEDGAGNDNGGGNDDGGNHDAGDDNGGQNTGSGNTGGGADDGSNHDAGNDNGDQTGGGNTTSGTNGGSHHGHGNDDTGSDN
jgi:hypothetical protein